MKAEDENGTDLANRYGIIEAFKYLHPTVQEQCKQYHQSQLQALKEEVEHQYNKSIEEVGKLSNEVPIAFSKGKRNAFKEVLNLITNLEE